MVNRTRSLLLAAGLLAPVLVLAGPAPAGAVDQDLVVSVTNGPPGTEVEVSSASCVSDLDGGVERFLSARLISGTAPDELLAGIGGGYEGEPATIVVPDWLDADAPAVIDAVCRSYSWDDDEETSEPYDVVAFDVEAGVGPSVQTRTISRTELLAGQALSVSAEGCTDGEYAGVAVFPGDDLSGRTFDQPVSEGDAEVGAGAFDVETTFSNSASEWSAFSSNGGPIVVDDLVEIPNDLAPGPYALVAFCGGESTSLVYEPSVVEITGSAPTTDLDLTSPEGSRAVSLDGASCTDTIAAGFFATDLDVLFDGSGGGAGGGAEFDAARSVGLRSPFGTGRRPADTASRRSSRASVARVIDDETFTTRDAEPSADGTWSIDETTSFDHGVVDGFAMCGDPLADGFVYDLQLVEVRAAVAPPTTTTTTTTTTPLPPAPPANALPGTPTYAG